ncbi:MAG TPA: hypothetical protein VGI29_08320 [Candidatus Binataceae bacterium]|jgi:hypothetical protein
MVLILHQARRRDAIAWNDVPGLEELDFAYDGPGQSDYLVFFFPSIAV